MINLKKITIITLLSISTLTLASCIDKNDDAKPEANVNTDIKNVKKEIKDKLGDAKKITKEEAEEVQNKLENLVKGTKDNMQKEEKTDLNNKELKNTEKKSDTKEVVRRRPIKANTTESTTNTKDAAGASDKPIKTNSTNADNVEQNIDKEVEDVLDSIFGEGANF